MSRSAHSRSYAPSGTADTELNIVNFMDSDVSNISIESFKFDKTLAAKAYVYLVKDPKWSFRIGVLRIWIKLFSCVLYVVGRVIEDNRRISPECAGSNRNETCEYFCPPDRVDQFNCSEWENLLWLHRSTGLWVAQLAVGILCMLETSIYLYIGAVFTHWRVFRAVNRYHILDYLTGIPFLLGLFSVNLRNLFVPVFLNVWSAKLILTVLLSDVYRVLRQEESQLAHRAFVLASTVISILFTSTCFIHHLQRVDVPWDLFESFWFVIVTITTVGYGDISPSRWPGQLYVIIMILASLYTLPVQIEALTAILRSQRVYGTPPKRGSNHVVVIGQLSPQDLHDMLSELYAYHRLQSMTVVILSPSEPNNELKLLLNVPLYRRRVVYLYGSALSDPDLERAQIRSANACFILGNRRTNNHQEEDQRTLLRCWAVRDYAPRVRMFVQLFDRRNKFHVNFAEHVMCLDEMKHALLATSCVCPGASTFLTLLLHTSRVKEGDEAAPWHRMYGQCSANEVYDITLSESSLFSRFAGKNFLFAATWVFRKSGYLLIGVRSFDSKETSLNPGREYILRPTDKLFYIAASREENAILTVPPPRVRPALRSMCATIAATNLQFLQLYGGRFEGKCKKDECALKKQMLRLECFSRGPAHLRFHPRAPNKANSSSSISRTHTSVDMTDGASLSRHDAADIVPSPHPYQRLPHYDHSHSHPPHRDFHGTDAVTLMREMRNIQGDHDTMPNFGRQPSRSDKLRHAFARQESAVSTKEAEDRQHLMPTPEDPMGSARYAQRRYEQQRRISALTAQRNEDLLGIAPPLNLEDLTDEAGPGDHPLTVDEQDELQQLEVGHEAVVEDEESEGHGEVHSVASAWVSPESYVIGEPRHVPYMQGKHRTRCHLLNEDKSFCCLELNKTCEHQDRSSPAMCQFVGAIIVGCAEADVSLFSFVTTLRAHYIAPESLLPIILLLRERPSESFLRHFACFPKLAFMVGSYGKLDDLLLAGILMAKAVIVLGSRKESEEIFMVDAQTVVGVQKLYRFFPKSNIITLLAHRSNMRFLNTKNLHRFPRYTDNNYMDGTGVSSPQKVTVKPTTRAGDHLHYMFCPQFAAGDVFTSSMLDTLLYQTYVKPWLLDFVRQLIGAKQNEKHQCCLCMVEVTPYLAGMKTYGRLLLHLSFKTGDLVIGLYRTLSPRSPEILACQATWMNDVNRIVTNRMTALGIGGTAPVSEPRGQSYVLINPPQDTPIVVGDKMYVIHHVPTAHSDAYHTPPGTPTDHFPGEFLVPDFGMPHGGGGGGQHHPHHPHQQQHHHHHYHHYHHHHPTSNLQPVEEMASLELASPPAATVGNEEQPAQHPRSAYVDMQSDDLNTPTIIVTPDSLTRQAISQAQQQQRQDGAAATSPFVQSDLGTRRRGNSSQSNDSENAFSFLEHPLPAPSTSEKYSGYAPLHTNGFVSMEADRDVSETAV